MQTALVEVASNIGVGVGVVNATASATSRLSRVAADIIGLGDTAGRYDDWRRSRSWARFCVAGKVVGMTKRSLLLVVDLVHGPDSIANVCHHIVLVLLERPNVVVPETVLVL